MLLSLVHSYTRQLHLQVIFTLTHLLIRKGWGKSSCQQWWRSSVDAIVATFLVDLQRKVTAGLMAPGRRMANGLPLHLSHTHVTLFVLLHIGPLPIMAYCSPAKPPSVSLLFHSTHFFSHTELHNERNKQYVVLRISCFPNFPNTLYKSVSLSVSPRSLDSI